MTCEGGQNMSFYTRWETSAIENYVGFWTSIYSTIFQTIFQKNQKIGIQYIYIYVFTTYIYIYIYVFTTYTYIYICSISRKHLHVFLVPFPPKKLWWKSSQEKAIPRPCPPVTSLVFCGLHQAPTLGFFVDFSRLKSWWRFFSTTKITWAMKSKTRVV